MNGAQLLRAHCDYSGLMSGPPALVADHDPETESAAENSGRGLDSADSREEEEAGGLRFFFRRNKIRGLPSFRQVRERMGHPAGEM